MKKTELLSWLREEHQHWEEFLDHISTGRMELPGVNGDWSMKDMVAHLTCYQPWVTARIQAAAHGAPEPLPPWPAQLKTDDEINAWIYESNHDRSVSEVLNDSRRVFQQFFAVIEELPEDVRIEELQHGERVFYLVWLGDQRYPVGEIFDHFHDDHESDIRAWLAGVENQ
ncbi:MAG: ClbS/DfsB family four-helix bundle protein [Anaerolineales bacterium]|jgi:hypothetical protein|nr:ClbS/DfsB family four-helix bundle protein [Anaerolineales bacterium]